MGVLRIQAQARRRSAKRRYFAAQKSVRLPRHRSDIHRRLPLPARPSTFLRQERGECKRWAEPESRGEDSRHRRAANARCLESRLPDGFGLRRPAMPRGIGLRELRNESGGPRPETAPPQDPAPGQLHFESYFPQSSTVVNGGRQRWTRAAEWAEILQLHRHLKARVAGEKSDTYRRACVFSVSGSNGSA